MDLCNVICVLIIIGILTVIAVDIHGKQLEKERIREAERKKKIKIIEEHKDNIKHQENAFRSEIQESFYSLNSFDSTIVRLSAIINNIKSENEALKKLSPNEGKDSIIRSLNKKLDQFRELGTKVDNTHFETVVLEDQYGKINKSFWEEIHELEQDNIDLIINDYNRFLKNVDYESFRFIEPGMLPKYVWFYAIQKPYSSEKFQFARDTFYSLYKECYVDLIIAELYAIKQMGGEGVLKERVRDLLKDKAPDNPVLAKFRRKLYCNELETLASGLMWMNAYQEENMIL